MTKTVLDQLLFTKFTFNMLLKSGLFKPNLHQMVDGLCTTPRHQKIYTNSFMSDLFFLEFTV